MNYITEGTYGNFSSFKIAPTENGGHKVYLNGMEIPYVKHVEFEVGVDCIATATVQFTISKIDCDYRNEKGDATS